MGLVSKYFLAKDRAYYSTLKCYVGFNGLLYDSVNDQVGFTFDSNTPGWVGNEYSTDRVTGTHSIEFIDDEEVAFLTHMDEYSLTDGTNDLTTYTISWWVKAETARENFPIQKRTSSDNGEWQIFRQSSGNISLVLYNFENPLSNQRFINFPVGFSSDWKKVDIVYDNGTYKTYVDAIEATNTVSELGTYVKMELQTGTNLNFGTLSGNNGSICKIDAFSIDSRALGQEEITKRYNDQLSGIELVPEG